MPIRVECDQCQGKISVDDAFAGSVCRCPYCKAMVIVPRSDNGGASRPRPEAPVSRPVAPPSAAHPVQPPPQGQTAGDQGDKPLFHAEDRRRIHARKHQAVIVIVAVLLIIAFAGVAVILMQESGGQDDAYDPDKPVPYEPDQITQPRENVTGPNILGQIRLASPTIYVLDAGGSMVSHFGQAAEKIAESVVSLGPEGQFNLYVAEEEGVRKLGQNLAATGPRGAAKVREMTSKTYPTGATSQTLADAIKQAIEAKPDAVVVVTAKEIEQAGKLSDLARARGVKVHAAAMVEDQYVAESLKKIATGSMGQFAAGWD
ncbi:MAG: hypothetical protein ACOCZE_08635 [Planctomycetota bacterium]